MSKDAGLQLKLNQKWTPLNVFFKYFDHFPEELHSWRSFLSNDHFCKTSLSRYFCNLCSLSNRNSISNSFFQYFHLSTTYDTKCDNTVEMTYQASGHRDLTIMWLFCVVISVNITFTSYMNKTYNNAVQYWRDGTNLKIYFSLLNSTPTNYTEFWKIQKELTKNDWSTYASEPIPMKLASCLYTFSVILER